MKKAMLASLLVLAAIAGTEYTTPNPWLYPSPVPLPPATTWVRRDPWLAAALGGLTPLAFYGVTRMGLDCSFQQGATPDDGGQPLRLAAAAATGGIIGLEGYAEVPAYTYAGAPARGVAASGIAFGALVAMELAGFAIGAALHPDLPPTTNPDGSMHLNTHAFAGGVGGLGAAYSFWALGYALGAGVDAYVTADRLNREHGTP